MRSEWREQVGLVAGREVRERSRALSFRVTTLILVLVAAAGVAIPALVAGGRSVERVGIVGSGAALTRAVEEAGRVTGTAVEVTPLPSLAAARRALVEGTVAAVLVGEQEVLVDRLPAPGTTSSLARLTTALAQLAGLVHLASQLPPAALKALERGAALPVRGVRPSPHLAATRFAGLTAVVLIYTLILFYGSRIAVSVGEEKATRVVEVLLATLRPTQLLVGKILGIGAVAVAQLAAVVATVLVAAAATGSSLLGGAYLGVIGVSSCFFLVGFAFYSTAFAAAASLVTRQADAYNVTIPIQIPLVVAYILSLSVVFGTISPLARVLAFLPPTAPVSMTILYAAGGAPLWQVGISLLACIAGTVATARLAGTIYERAILRTGPRVRLGQILRSPPV